MYSFSTTVNDTFKNTELKVIEALKAEGFGVLTEIDVQATLKNKLGLEKAPYKILGACNPALANQAIDAEPDIGLLLPCNVVLREETAGEVIVSFMDPIAVLSLVNRDDVAVLASTVREKLLNVKNAL